MNIREAMGQRNQWKELLTWRDAEHEVYLLNNIILSQNTHPISSSKEKLTWTYSNEEHPNNPEPWIPTSCRQCFFSKHRNNLTNTLTRKIAYFYCFLKQKGTFSWAVARRNTAWGAFCQLVETTTDSQSLSSGKQQSANIKGSLQLSTVGHSYIRCS